MANFITLRTVIDKIVVDGCVYERKIIFNFQGTPNFEIIWYEYYKGKHQIKDDVKYGKLEQLYRDNRDRVHGYEPKN